MVNRKKKQNKNKVHGTSSKALPLHFQENTLQVVLATDGEQTYALFLYLDIEWGSSSTTIGFNAGDQGRFFTLPESLTNGVLDLESTSNVGTPGMYVFRIDQRRVTIPQLGE